MTSEERHELRYQRRKAKREEKRRKITESQQFKKLFTTGNLYDCYRKCTKGVKWKASTQKYIDEALLYNYRTKKSLLNGTYRASDFHEFDLKERGKDRHIQSTDIKDRVVLKNLNINSLSCVLNRTFIYDNSACLKNKGYHFNIRRTVKHLQEHYRKWGTEGYILLFDFTKFFANVSHQVLETTLRKEYNDKWILGLIMHFIRKGGSIGLGLGSEINQTLAVSSANELDHFIKEKLRIKQYSRYNDDGYLMHPVKEYLKKCLEWIKKVCEKLGIKINLKKTCIVKIKQGFNWLKCRFRMLPSGKIVKKIYKRSVTKMRQKIKTLNRLYKEKRISLELIRGSVQSWISYALNFDACMTVKNMVGLIFDLFGKEDATKLLKVKKLKHNRIRKKMRYVQYLVNGMTQAA